MVEKGDKMKAKLYVLCPKCKTKIYVPKKKNKFMIFKKNPHLHRLDGPYFGWTFVETVYCPNCTDTEDKDMELEDYCYKVHGFKLGFPTEVTVTKPPIIPSKYLLATDVKWRPGRLTMEENMECDKHYLAILKNGIEIRDNVTVEHGKFNSDYVAVITTIDWKDKVTSEIKERSGNE